MRITLVAVLAAALVLGVGCRRESAFEEHLSAAKDLRDGGNLAEAELELRRAVKAEPQNAEGAFQLAQVLADERKFDDALFYFNEAHRLDPNDVRPAVGAASIQIGVDNDEARRLAEEALAKAPSDPIVRDLLSQLALSENDMEAALQNALTATELDPKHGESWRQLAFVRLVRFQEAVQTGESPPVAELEGGLEAVDQAISLSDPAWGAEILRCRILAAWPGRETEAREAFHKLAARVPDERSAVLQLLAQNMSAFAKKHRDRPLMREALEVSIRANDQNLAAWELVARLDEEKEKGSGDAVYHRLLEQRPADPVARDGFAAYLMSQRRPADAEAVLKKALTETPHARIGARLVELQLGTRRMDEARATLADLEKTYPDSPYTRIARARIALAEGRLDDAAAQLGPAMAATSEAEPARLLASTELRRGRYAEARTAAEEAQRRSPGFDVLTAHLLAEIEFRERAWPRLMRTLVSISRVGERLTPREWALLGVTHYQLGNKQRARQVLEKASRLKRPSPLGVRAFAANEFERDPDAVFAMIDRVLQARPADSRFLEMRARLLARADRRDEALKQLDQDIAAHPGQPALLGTRGELRLAAGDAAGAAEDARAVLDLEPASARARSLLVDAYLAQGKLAELVKEFEVERTAGRLDERGLTVLAGVKAQLGDDAEAIEILEGVHHDHPQDPIAMNNLAQLLAEQDKDLDRALSLARDAVAAKPNSVEMLDTLGFVYLKKSLYEPALFQFDAALDLDPADTQAAQLQLHRSRALEGLGRSDEAAKALKEANELDPDVARRAEARGDRSG